MTENKKKRWFIFLGPPASGKGTQSDLVAKELGLPSISPGELLRHEEEKGTPLGKRVAKSIDKGVLISDKIIYKIMDRRLQNEDAKQGAVFDGYPRRASQLDDFQSLLRKRKSGLGDVKAFYIHIPDQEAEERISGRRVCDCGASYHIRFNPPKKENICDLCGKLLEIRPDDKPEVMQKRLKAFHRQTKGLLKFFEQKKVLQRIDGEQKIIDITKEILGIIKNDK